ncbi:MAG: septum formation inhibitor Maf [Clostridia bacterium]|nr:septum formation inhibitor Maf [Clostridia bacterium]
MKRIVLASASPRRRELIKLISDNVICVTSGEDENLPEGLAVSEIPEYLARLKASSVAREYPDDIVIGSDTVVILDGRLLSKPASEEDAFQKLSTLSGRTHQVITGCCIVHGDKTLTFSETTEVEFLELSAQEINDYIATGEPMDKAGAYGIQGRGALFVKGIKGDYFNVVGLPVAGLKRQIEGFCKE